MQKIAIGPGYNKGVAELDASPPDNIRRLAKAKGVPHDDIIAAVRGTRAAVRPISDGDVSDVIYAADPDNRGVDIYMSAGGAPEGVLAAAVLRCIGGQMQCRLVLDTDEKRERAARMGIGDRGRYS